LSFDLRALLPILYSPACEWAQSQFELITRDGASLTEPELDLARRVGVQQPETVRILQVASIPLPTDPALRQAGILAGLFTPETAGLTLSYGIFIRRDCRGDQRLVAHELRHSAQYEAYGSIPSYLAVYLQQVVDVGYKNAPFEIDAVEAAANVHSITP
jgi:hypothetical protein